MNRLTLVLALTTLAAACTVAGAQEAAPDAAAKAPREEKKRERDPAVDAWAETLAAQLNHENKRIRASAARGLVALGPAALKTLGKRAGSDDEKVANAAMNLIARIKAGQTHGRRVDHRGARGDKDRGKADRGREGARRRGPDGARRGGPDGMRGRGPRAGSARGQRGDRRGPPKAPQRHHPLEDLGLDDAQREAVEGLLELHHDRMRKAFEEAGERPGREAMMKSRDESLETLRTSLVEAVGEEQAKKVLEAMPGPDHRGPGSFGPPRRGQRPGGPGRRAR